MGYYVLGVHRSGTSAVSRALALLVGDELEPGVVPSNPHGQWERLELRHHLDRLLLTHRATWDHPPPPGAAWTSPPVGARTGRWAAAALTRLGPGPWVWKDPRLCLTLPFWLGIDQPPPRFVVVVRPPHEVARSLMARDRRSVGSALALWERTARSLVTGLGPAPAFVVPYPRLVADPTTTVEALARWVGPDLVADPAQAAATIITPGPAGTGSDQGADQGVRSGATAEPEPGTDEIGLTPEQAELWAVLDQPLGPGSLPPLTSPESPTTASLLGRPTLGRRLAVSARCAARHRRHRG